MSSGVRSTWNSRSTAFAAELRFLLRPHAMDAKLSATSAHLMGHHLTHSREKLCRADGFLQDGFNLARSQRSDFVAGDHDNADALILKVVDQVVRRLAMS